MCDLIAAVISCCVWSCDTGKINVYDKIMIEKPEKVRENFFYINIHLIDGLGMEITAC